MIRRMLPLLLLCGCATASERAASADARAARDAARLADVLDGLAAGETRDCLDTVGRSMASEVIGDTIVYRASPSRIWTTQTSGSCASGGGDPILVTRQIAGQLCQGDIVRAVDRTGGMLVASCSVGRFTLHTRSQGETS